MVPMGWVVWLMPILFSTHAAGLFTIDFDKRSYKSEFRGEVLMGCRFQPPSPAALSGIKVTWHWIAPGDDVREVFRLENGVEQLTTQHPDYVGRSRLLTEELKQGWAKLKVSNLRISDRGKYQCFVQTDAGADYKIVTLSIFAPFKTIDKKIERIPEREEVMLICRSEGYPQPEIMWHGPNGQQVNSTPMITVLKSEDELFEITTRINVTTLDKKKYICNFTEQAATFTIPDDISSPAERNNTIVVVLILAVVLSLVILFFVLYRFHKGLRSTWTRHLVDTLGRALVLPAVNEKKNDTINKEEKHLISATINNVCLKKLLKDNYLKWIKTLPWNQGDIQVSCFTLCNNDGQEVNVHDLVPAVGDTLVLEGSRGSGKTTLASMLVFSWIQQSVKPLFDFSELSHLQLVAYVDGSKANGNLLHEIIMQQSLEEVLSEDDLRNMLTDEALLIVDGYKEGNLLFDESLQKFLSDRRGCRVLITTSLQHSKVKDIVGTETIVRVQRQSQKY